MKLDSPRLVAPVGFKGALVADISRKAAEGLYEFRSLLGGGVDRRAATHLTHDALSQARDLVTWRPLARLRDDPLAALRHGGDLHQILVLKVENGQDATTLEDFCAQRSRSRAMLLSWDGRRVLWGGEHR